MHHQACLTGAASDAWTHLKLAGLLILKDHSILRSPKAGYGEPTRRDEENVNKCNKKWSWGRKEREPAFCTMCHTM